MISSAILPYYREQVDLLLQIMPLVGKEGCFALNGGTAINMFIWDMPRLSVDIDLAYLPFDDRSTAMKNIAAALQRIKARIDEIITGCKSSVAPQTDGQEAKLICRNQAAQIKIEVNTIIRGRLFKPQIMDLTDTVEEEFKRFVSMLVVAPAELFGGKICAALDRQHPRDLFDIKQLYTKNGLTEDIRHGFLIHLLSTNRPLHEIIYPKLSDQRRAFETQFAGMTQEPFTYEDFEVVRERLIKDISDGLNDADRRFLVSFKSGNPIWSLFPHERLKELPAIQWKLSNILVLKLRNPTKHAEQLKRLEERLYR